MNSDNNSLIEAFLFGVLGSALLTKILKKTSGSGCCPVAISLIIGLLVGIFSYLPNAIWFNFPHNYTIAGIVDDVIAITLAGAAISCIVLKSGGGNCCCPMCKCLKSKGSCGDKTGSCGTEKTGSCGDSKPMGSCGDKGSDDKKGGCCH